MKQEALRAIIYTRVAQAAAVASLIAQEKLCQEFIAKQGWTHVRTLSDCVGANSHRPQYKKLLECVREGNCDVVVVAREDRLERMPFAFTALQQTFQASGVQLKIAEGQG